MGWGGTQALAQPFSLMLRLCAGPSRTVFIRRLFFCVGQCVLHVVHLAHNLCTLVGYGSLFVSAQPDVNAAIEERRQPPGAKQQARHQRDRL